MNTLCNSNRKHNNSHRAAFAATLALLVGVGCMDMDTETDMEVAMSGDDFVEAELDIELGERDRADITPLDDWMTSLTSEQADAVGELVTELAPMLDSVDPTQPEAREELAAYRASLLDGLHDIVGVDMADEMETMLVDAVPSPPLFYDGLTACECGFQFASSGFAWVQQARQDAYLVYVYTGFNNTAGNAWSAYNSASYYANFAFIYANDAERAEDYHNHSARRSAAATAHNYTNIAMSYNTQGFYSSLSLYISNFDPNLFPPYLDGVNANHELDWAKQNLNNCANW